MYDATGHMMVEFEKMPPPAKFASGDDWNPTPEEARAALLGYIAYFGTYTVDEAAHAVTHHVEGSLNPELLRHRPAPPGEARGQPADAFRRQDLPRRLGARALTRDAR